MINKAILFAGAALLAAPALAQTNAANTSGALTGRAPAATSDSTGTNPMQTPGTASAATTGRTSASASTPQTAGVAGKVVTGATVSDTKGGTVGTIDSVDGEFAILDTGTNKVRLPMTSFAAGTSGPVIAMTKAEVDAAAGGAAEADKAALTAMLTAGAKVSDTQGGPVGTIEANDGQFITVATAKNKVKLPVAAFGKGASGVVIGMTAAQLDSAAKAAAPASGG